MQRLGQALNYGRAAGAPVVRVYSVAFYDMYRDEIYKFPRTQRRRMGLRAFCTNRVSTFPPDAAHMAAR